MNVVYALDVKTQIGYAVAAYETSQQAIDRKDSLQAKYPANIFYHRVNTPYPEVLYPVEEALLIVNRR